MRAETAVREMKQDRRANGVRGGPGVANLELAQRLVAVRGARRKDPLAEVSAGAAANPEPASPAVASVAAEIPWEAVDPSPLNPRRHFAPEQLAELAESIAELGVKQNVLVRPRGDAPGRYWLIAGERRYRAVGLLVETGRADPVFPLPARVEWDCEDDCAHLKLAMVENLQREGLNPMEEAEGYAALTSQGMSAGAIAREVLGRPEKTRFVQLRIALTSQLCPEAQEALREGRISVEQARALKLAPVADQARHLEGIATGKWGYTTTELIRRTVRQTFVPVKEHKKLRAAYESRGAPIVTDEDTGEELYADPAVLREIRDEEVEKRKQALSRQYPWVEVRDATARNGGYFHPAEYEKHPGHELAGAVIAVGYDGQVKEHRDLVRTADLKRLADGARVDPEKGRVEASPWTKGHLIHAKGRKSAALRRAVAADPQAATRLVCLALLGVTSCVALRVTGRDGSHNAGWNPPLLEEEIEHFRRGAGLAMPFEVGSTGLVVNRAEDDREIWRGLAALHGPELDRLFAALVALQVGSYNGYEPRPEDVPVAAEVARSLGLAGLEDHGLCLEPDDLEGLRRTALLEAAKLAGLETEAAQGMSTKQLREHLAALPEEVRRRVVLPTLRFRTRDEMLGVHDES